MKGERNDHVFYDCAKKHDPILLEVVDAANNKHWLDIELEEKKKQKEREKLIDHYKTKPLSKFVQYDAFVDCDENDDIKPNPETGVYVFCGKTTELMGTCNEVRILISEKATKSDVLRGNKEVTDMIKKGNTKADQTLYQVFEEETEKILESRDLDLLF